MDAYSGLSGILALIGVFGSVALLIYLYFTSRHRERMALIENDKDAGIFLSNKRGTASLRFGLLFLAIGCGIIIGSVLNAMGIDEAVSYFSSIFICSGVSLLLYYRRIKSE